MKIEFEKLISKYLNDRQIAQKSSDELMQYFSMCNYAKDHILLTENGRTDFAYFIVKGAVRSYYLKDGKEVNTWFSFENEMVGSLHTYNGKTSRETFQVLENSIFISINLHKLKSLTLTNIDISNFINAIIEEYALFLEERLYFTQFTTSKKRYQYLLENEPQIFQRISLTDIASYLGISRETLSRLRGM